MGRKVKTRERKAPEVKEFDCVEIYLPKRLKHLSEIYRFLRERLISADNLTLKGFSVYEVDGVFSGQMLWEERTLVIRVLFPRSVTYPRVTVQAAVNELGRAIVETVAPDEEEIWICHYRQVVTTFRPLSKVKQSLT